MVEMIQKLEGRTVRVGGRVTTSCTPATSHQAAMRGCRELPKAKSTSQQLFHVSSFPLNQACN